MDFLKELFGTEAITFEQFAEKVKKGGLKLADLSKGEYVGIEKFKALEAERDGLNTQIGERDKQLSELQKAAGSNTELTEQLKAAQESNKKLQEEHEAQLKQIRLDSAVEKALIESKAKNQTAAKALLNDFLQNAELDDSGNVKGLAEAIKGLVEGEDTAFMFDKAANEPFKPSGASPADGKDGLPPTKVGKEMTYDEICAFMDSNPGAQLP